MKEEHKYIIWLKSFLYVAISSTVTALAIMHGDLAGTFGGIAVMFWILTIIMASVIVISGIIN